MSIFVILQIIWEIIKLILSRPKEQRAALQARLRQARKTAQETGDTSELEKMWADLSGRA